MRQFQLLLLSFEQNIPGCTVLLLSLPRLTSRPFQLKALKNVGMSSYVGREKQQCKKYCFFWRSLQSCGYRIKKELHLHPFLYSGQWLWVGRTDTKKMHWVSSWRKEVLCVGPFLKEHNLIQALPGWEQFDYIYVFLVVFFFFYVKFLTWFGEHKICNSNFSPVHSSCNTEVTCKIALLHSVNMCVFPVSLVCKQSAQIRYFWILLVSLFCLILNSEHNSLSIVQEAFLSVACNI